MYSATPARATIERPGSMKRRGCGHAETLAGGEEWRHDHLGVVVGRRRELIADVADGEAATGAELVHLESELVPHIRCELQHNLDGLRVRVELEDR